MRGPLVLLCIAICACISEGRTLGLASQHSPKLFTKREHQQERRGKDDSLSSSSSSSSSSSPPGLPPIARLLSIRGGVKRAASSKSSASKDGKGKLKVNSLNSKKSLLKSVKEALAQVKPATRAYMVLSFFCTLIHMIGLPAPALFSLDKARLFEIWRPFTAVAYLGAPSMSMANSAYFLVRYGQQLETLNGLGAHTWFLLVQTVILTALGLLLGFPFTAQAMIAATVYVSAHLNPMERMPFQFGFVITSWQLPFAMMAIDCLSQQNAAAAWPHVLGILSGHTFHFFTKLWPQLGGRAWLDPPKWWIKRLGGAPSSNVAIDFSKGGKGKQQGGGKRKPSGKARKLGSGPLQPQSPEKNS